jgi:hypothetical protein
MGAAAIIVSQLQAGIESSGRRQPPPIRQRIPRRER